MGTETETSPPTRKSFIELAEFALKVLGVGTLLTAVMGWPAVSLHYRSYGIPADFVTTEAAVRAGIQPALGFMLIFGYFWYVLRACQRHLPRSHDASSTPLFLFHVVPLAAIALLIRFAGVSSGVFVLLWWLLENWGLVYEPWGGHFWLLVGVSIPLGVGLILATLAAFRHFNRHEFPLEGEPEPLWTTALYVSLIEYIEFTKNFIAIYLLSFFLKIAFPEIAQWFKLPSILVASAFLALAAMMVGVGIAVLKGVADLAIGNLRQSSAFIVITALLTVWMYSTDLYPSLPKSLGGGKPNTVDLWIEKSRAPSLSEWQRASPIGELYYIRSGHLLHLDSKIAIVTERPEPPTKWIIIPRSVLASVTGS